MTEHTLRIGSRKSELALEQTYIIERLLKETYPHLKTEIITSDTLGDKNLISPLQAFGGKGVFVSELEEALLNGQIDLAVHSAKDMPAKLDPGLCIAAVSHREYPGDVFLTRNDTDLASFKGKTFIVGTSSPRRQCFFKECWKEIWEQTGTGPVPELIFETLRGNVHTRLTKLKNGLYDGIILAQAGLTRLGIGENEDLHFYSLDPKRFIPAGGQGILAVEAKAGSAAARLCEKIDVPKTHICLDAERGVLAYLNAGCHEPIGVYASIEGKDLTIRAAGAVSGTSHTAVKHVCITGSGEKEELERMIEEIGKGLGRR